MSPLDVLKAIGKAAVKYGPDAVELVGKVIDSAREEHPELREPPPERADDEIAATTDAALDAKFGKGTQ